MILLYTIPQNERVKKLLATYLIYTKISTKNKERKAPHQFPWPYVSLSCETSLSLTQLVLCAVIRKKYASIQRC